MQNGSACKLEAPRWSCGMTRRAHNPPARLGPSAAKGSLLRHPPSFGPESKTQEKSLAIQAFLEHVHNGLFVSLLLITDVFKRRFPCAL
ncbi:hypothetical protein AAFF_G00342130 [Aldrovandia affinis]|uniref:Uncharacterized protein n=1 Tax=Aldrovandia affinis TaxID=143900 RepID=A0AAD7R5V7_9TELE|nr:hypothetical protein AAFF_G00342130 [Aldrovandia affinis]